MENKPKWTWPKACPSYDDSLPEGLGEHSTTFMETISYCNPISGDSLNKRQVGRNIGNFGLPEYVPFMKDDCVWIRGDGSVCDCILRMPLSFSQRSICVAAPYAAHFGPSPWQGEPGWGAPLWLAKMVHDEDASARFFKPKETDIFEVLWWGNFSKGKLTSTMHKQVALFPPLCSHTPPVLPRPPHPTPASHRSIPRAV